MAEINNSILDGSNKDASERLKAIVSELEKEKAIPTKNE